MFHFKWPGTILEIPNVQYHNFFPSLKYVTEQDKSIRKLKVWWGYTKENLWN